jgi:DNA-binding NtrC family response regulator
MCEARAVDIDDLSVAAPGVASSQVNNLTLMEAMERNTILQMLKDAQGNKFETARRLGIGRQTLYNKIKSYGIET